jgi:hypothetical protein
MDNFICPRMTQIIRISLIASNIIRKCLTAKSQKSNKFYHYFLLIRLMVTTHGKFLFNKLSAVRRIAP